MSDNTRHRRVNELLHESLSGILRGRFGAQTVAITITRVDCTPDLRHAYVYYSVMTDDKATAVAFFRAHSGAISLAFARDVILKRHPQLHFVYDDSLRNMAAVDRILRDIDAAPRAQVKPTTAPKSRSYSRVRSTDLTASTPTRRRAAAKAKRPARSTERQARDES